MTHFRVEIQLPLRFNPEKGEKEGKEIPKQYFLDTYYELLKIAGGIHTTQSSIFGSWIHPKTKKVYHDKTIPFIVLVESEDKMTVGNVPKIKKLLKYKKTLLKRFKQKEFFIVTTRCCWL